MDCRPCAADLQEALRVYAAAPFPRALAAAPPVGGWKAVPAPAAAQPKLRAVPAGKGQRWETCGLGEGKVQTGLVCSWWEDRGYGFVRGDADGVDYFCHREGVAGGGRGMALLVGRTVTFTVSKEEGRQVRAGAVQGGGVGLASGLKPPEDDAGDYARDGTRYGPLPVVPGLLRYCNADALDAGRERGCR